LVDIESDDLQIKFKNMSTGLRLRCSILTKLAYDFGKIYA